MLLFPGLSLKGQFDPQLIELVTQFSAILTNLWAAPTADQAFADTHVEVIDSTAVVQKIPIPISAMGFNESGDSGDRHYNELDWVAIALEARPWDGNFRESMKKIKAIEGGNFKHLATLMALQIAAARDVKPRLLAQILALGKTKARTYEGKPLFVDGTAEKHLYNPKDESIGSFGNLNTGAAAAGFKFNAANFEKAQINAMTRKKPNGSPLGLRVTHVLGGTRMLNHFRNILSRDQAIGRSEVIDAGGGNTTGIAVSETNIHKGGAIYETSGWLDNDPYYTGKPAAAQVWYACSYNLPMARAAYGLSDNGGKPKVNIYGPGTEICDLAKGGGHLHGTGDLELQMAAGLPHVIERFEYDGT
jgi:hypothetical protein